MLSASRNRERSASRQECTLDQARIIQAIKEWMGSSWVRYLSSRELARMMGSSASAAGTVMSAISRDRGIQLRSGIEVSRWSKKRCSVWRICRLGGGAEGADPQLR